MIKRAFHSRRDPRAENRQSEQEKNDVKQGERTGGASASERNCASVHETGKLGSCFSFSCSMRRGSLGVKPWQSQIIRTKRKLTMKTGSLSRGRLLRLRRSMTSYVERGEVPGIGTSWWLSALQVVGGGVLVAGYCLGFRKCLTHHAQRGNKPCHQQHCIA